MLGSLPEGIDLNRFDALGIHYTLHLSEPENYFLNESAISRIATFRGIKCVWLQDEYRRVNALRRTLKRLGVTIIFSLASGQTLEQLYPSSDMPGVRKETVFAGYVPKQSPDALNLGKQISERPIDVGYRARRPPYWLGSLGQEKINIGLGFIRHPESHSLSLDISVDEQDRLYGIEWDSFLRKCKAVLCVESGSSVIDFSGQIESSVNMACTANTNHSFSEIRSLYLANIDGLHVINPISPRVFEAAAAGTVMICFPGRYSGLLEPWKHYIPLARDFSNMHEIAETLHNPRLLRKISEAAYQDLILDPRFSYDAFSQFCSEVITQEYLKTSQIDFQITRYSDADFSHALKKNLFSSLGRKSQLTLQRLLLGSKIRGPMFYIWYMLPNSIRTRIRPMLKIISR